MTDQQNQNPEAPKWFIDEGIPGVGERPSWLSDKFKTAADLGKSYSELEKKFGTAPEEYDFSKSRYLDPDYAPFQDLKQLAKDKRVPAEVMDKMLESVDKYMDEFSTDPQDEIKKLGDNATERLTTLDNWAKANLSKDSYEVLTSNLRTADSIKALEELRGKMMSTNPHVPNGNDGATHNTATLEDIKMELSNNLQKYKTDPKYQKDIQSRLEIAAKNVPGFVDKVGA
jgi:DNA repair ATPase RecN